MKTKNERANTNPLNLHPLVYTISEGAQLLRISGVTVRRLAKSGRLARVRGLHRFLVPVPELERFVRENSERLR